MKNRKQGFMIVGLVVTIVIVAVVGLALTRNQSEKLQTQAKLDAVMQEEMIEQTNASLIAEGDLIETGQSDIIGQQEFQELGTPERQLRGSIVADGRIESPGAATLEMVRLEDEEGEAVPYSASYMIRTSGPSGGGGTIPVTLSPSVSISASPSTLEEGENYTISWTSTDMIDGVVVRELPSTDISTELSGSQGFTGNSVGNTTYRISGYVEGVLYEDTVTVVVNGESQVSPPPGEINIWLSPAPRSLWGGPAMYEDESIQVNWSWSNMQNISIKSGGWTGWRTSSSRNGSSNSTLSFWTGYVRDVYSGREHMYDALDPKQVKHGMEMTGTDLNGDNLRASVGFRILERTESSGGPGDDDDDDTGIDPPDNPGDPGDTARVSIWAEPMTVEVGQSYQVIWDSAYTGGVTVAGNNWSSALESGTQTFIDNVPGQKTYTISGGGETASVQVMVTDPSNPPDPWVWIDAAPKNCYIGDEVFVPWNSAGCGSVSVSGPGLSSSNSEGGYRRSFSSAGNYTYTISGCGESSSVTINVSERPAPDPWVWIDAAPKSLTEGEQFLVAWDSTIPANVVCDEPNIGVLQSSQSGSDNQRFYTDSSWASGGPLTLRFSISGGGESSSVNVTVNEREEPEPTNPGGGTSGGGGGDLWIQATPNEVVKGETFLLEWSSSNSADVYSHYYNANVVLPAGQSTGYHSMTIDTDSWEPMDYPFIIDDGSETARDTVRVVKKPDKEYRVSHMGAYRLRGDAQWDCVGERHVPHASLISEVQSQYPARLHDEIDRGYWMLMQQRPAPGENGEDVMVDVFDNRTVYVQDYDTNETVEMTASGSYSQTGEDCNEGFFTYAWTSNHLRVYASGE